VLFGEDQARYVIVVQDNDAVRIVAEARAANVPTQVIGVTRGTELVLPGGESVAVAKLRRAHEGWFPNYMGADPV
jgi:phosphoribosylformylglycinamidine synthase